MNNISSRVGVISDLEGRIELFSNLNQNLVEKVFINDCEITKLRETLKLCGDYIAKFELTISVDKLNQEQALEQIIRALK